MVFSLGSFVVSFWGLLELFWGLLGSLCGLLEPFWGLLGSLRDPCDVPGVPPRTPMEAPEGSEAHPD